jgi:hypothetical protein
MASVSISATATGSSTATLSWSISGVTIAQQPWFFTLNGSGTISPSSVGPQSNGGTSGTAYVTGLSPSTNYSWTINAETPSGVPGPNATSNTITTSAATPAPSWTDQALGSFQATVAYSDGVTASNASSYAVYSGSLPTGISLTPGSGAVTGTPTVASQAYSFVLSATGAGGTITTSTFSGTVSAAPTAGKIKTWNGSAWVYGTVKVWSGSDWVTGTAKVWNGSAWVTSV